MPDINHQNAENRPLEADIARLSREIAEKKNLPEHKNLSEKELIKQTLQPVIRRDFAQSNPPPTQTKTQDENFLPDYLKNSPAEIKSQVEKLVESAFSEGIEKAAKEAGRNGAFILDAFHDTLTDKLYEELKGGN